MKKRKTHSAALLCVMALCGWTMGYGADNTETGTDTAQYSVTAETETAETAETAEASSQTAAQEETEDEEDEDAASAADSTVVYNLYFGKFRQ